MTFSVPTAEQRFVLRHIAGINEMAATECFAGLSDDLVEAILYGAAAFAEGEYAPLLRLGDTQGAQWHEGSVTMPVGFKAAYRAFFENGWGAIAGPQAFGGQGLPFSLATIVMEDLGTANLGFSLVNMLTPGAIEALAAHGTGDQQQTWLPKLITGEWTGTMNLTEPQAGSDVGAVRASASPAPDGTWRIKGQKIFITFGEHDLVDNILHLILARTSGAPEGTKGLSLFLVPKFRLDASGKPGDPNDVHCVSIEHKLGIHASPTCVMSYGDHDDCVGELVGEEGGGMRAMFTMMNNARINVGNQGVQVAERATQLALDYARERIQSPRADGSSGKTPVAILDHPDVRRMALRMKAQTQAARSLLYYAAGQVDRAHMGDRNAATRADLVTPLIKAHGTDIGCEVASLGVQIHGGMGFIEEAGAAQHYRDARITPIYEGTNGIQAADLVGRKLKGDGGVGLRALLAEIRAEVNELSELATLADGVEEVADWMLTVPNVNDRLAGSYPFLTMLSVLTCGWLMARQERIARAMMAADEGDSLFLKAKLATTRFYISQLVPEALGLRAAALAGAQPIYALTLEEMMV
ncbi:acyl-CoA dehydrogenase [Sphingobium sp. Ant17]|uniref:acyl-CoA dehydrogenase n=1 Tax=Sphingobium sp. Ant17 TaxID=1461752 RepID=UPI000445CFD8|nr:acyl-CoA dehydrogenase [Sphingobium sp. Ant17]EXS70655.1 acyl-CoA dehydrogenase [Sphingobium sp. Ant17]